MSEIFQESPFIIKNEKYSLDIILKYKTPNGISYKGITIYKRDCEINFLNEESLLNLENNKEKEANYNYIYSFANIGFISISHIICFLYLKKNDIILLNDTEEYIFYKVKNLHYIKMTDIYDLEDENVQKNFKLFKDFFVSENLYFSFSKYGNNILNHHIYSSNNYCYNEKYFILFKQANAIEYVTPIIKGVYKHLVITNKKLDENISNNNENNNTNYLTIDIIIQNRIKQHENDNEILQLDNIINSKENFQEIQIDIYSGVINKTIKYKFYSFNGENFFNIDYLYSLINSNKEIQQGLILSGIDSVYDKKNEKNENNISISDEKLKDIFDIKVFNDCKRNNIKKLVFENVDIIKNIFEKEEQGEQNSKILIISGSSYNCIFNLTQEIIHTIIYLFFNKYLNKENNNDDNDMLIGNAKTRIDNFFSILDEIVCKKMMKLIKYKLPKICYVNKKYAQENLSMSINNSSNVNNNIQNKTNNINFQKKFTIFILTYNVCGMNKENIYSINFQHLLFPEKAKVFFKQGEKNIKKQFPFFYCIGLEEVVDLNPKNVIIGGEKEKYNIWEEKITSELKSKNNYVLLLKSNLVGILFFIYVQASEVSKIKNIKCTKTKTGFYGQLGNKGSCFVEFEYENKKYGFSSGHLTAGETIKNNNKRKNNLINILNHKSDKDSKEFYLNDFYFIFGDLNFRVQNSIKIIHNWLFSHKFEGKENIKEGNNINDKSDLNEKNNVNDKNNNNNNDTTKNIEANTFSKDNIASVFDNSKEEEDEKFYQIDENIFMKYFGEDYLKFDQLNMFKKELSEYDTKESNILFYPTYKYTMGTNNYNILKREPSWTDRILFKESNLIKSIIYDRINIHHSDHKPIFSLFEINY